MKKLLLPAMLTSAMLLSSCAALRDAFIVITESVHPEWTNRPPVVVTNEVPQVPVPVPEPPPPVVEQPVSEIDWSKATYKKIAKDVGAWQVTANLTSAKVKGDKLYTAGSNLAWPCITMGDASIQGCFALAVEQPDGRYIVGTWDWDRCGHQKTKTIDNLLHGTEHAFFNLRPGARIYWFVTAMSRDNKRTVKERSNLIADTWK